MTKEQFKNLKVGDLCTIRRGVEAGRLCEVAFIEDESILVRSVDHKPLLMSTRRTKTRLRLTGPNELDLFKEES